MKIGQLDQNLCRFYAEARTKKGEDYSKSTLLGFRHSIYQIECGLALSVLLSTTIFVITVVKMLWTHEAQPSESTTNFDHCDDEYRCR